MSSKQLNLKQSFPELTNLANNDLNQWLNQYDISQLDDLPTERTFFILLLEICYRAQREGPLLTKRKACWPNNYGTPSVDYILSFEAEIEKDISENCVDDVLESFNKKVDSLVIDKTNNVLISKDVKPSKPMPEVQPDGKFIQTLNTEGFMTTGLDPFSQKFVDNMKPFKTSKEQYLEIGAAYGVASLQGLKKEAAIYANDMDENQLKYIELGARGNVKHLHLVPGLFPNEFDFEENTFDGVLSCRVFHFFSGEELIKALKKLKQWMRPNGKVYIVVDTVYVSIWSSYVSTFEEKKKAGLKFPGEVYNAQEILTKYGDTVPSFFHIMDQDIVQMILKEAGFEIAESGYINRKGLFPEHILVDGRESVGVIGQKC